jgi:hypothetical protein
MIPRLVRFNQIRKLVLRPEFVLKLPGGELEVARNAALAFGLGNTTMSSPVAFIHA